MENKGNVVVILLIILIGAVCGVGLMIGVNNAITVGFIPINTKIDEISRVEKSIELKLSQMAQIQSRMALNGNGINGGNFQQQPQQQQPEDMNKVYDIPVGISSILGNKNAPVTIVEFTDFQCPYCARFYSAIKDVLGAYPDKVRVVIKNFPLPFHPNARPAAKLALAANEQGKFQGMMEALLANGGDVSDDSIKKYAKDLGLDYNKLMADYKNKDAQWEKQIQDDMQLGGNVDVRGTPTFFLNGRKTNSRDLATFKVQIDAIK